MSVEEEDDVSSELETSEEQAGKAAAKEAFGSGSGSSSGSDADEGWSRGEPLGEPPGERESQFETVVRGSKYNAAQVNAEVFEELELLQPVVEEVQGVWADFLQSAESRDAVGEALLAAVVEAAPSMQSLFKTARAITALRLMNGLSMVFNSLGDPKSLKVVVETLGFQHMDFEVTPLHVGVFREAIGELILGELGPRFTARAQLGWCTIMNYVGGAFIYLRVHCAERLRTLAASWATANSRRQGAADLDRDEEDSLPSRFSGSTVTVSSELAQKGAAAAAGKPPARGRSRSKWGWRSGGVAESAEVEGTSSKGSVGSWAGGTLALMNATVPTTFQEMFRFNAAVMGFGNHVWMAEILNSFDTIVTNASNTYRLQEECDVLSLRLAKYQCAINLAEYKAVMLASLRSLVPKDWNSAHEVAWSWLWDNVAHFLKVMMGQPAHMEIALERLWAGLGEDQLRAMRFALYERFFTEAPAGQDLFKQSTTRLHYIVDLVRGLTLEIYKAPTKVVEDISGIGLRHVGYGVPVDLIAPFVSSWVQVVSKVAQDDVTEHAFRWSISLISRIMKRVISEGSTIVMKAINANSAKMLRRAVACAPRGKRATWMLNVQVGTQRISPFMWALSSGSLEAAEAILVDLLTIRADRDRYYYAMDALFERHPDVIQRLTIDAPSLLTTLLDGLIWRSCSTEKGLRRVNYYIKHLVVGADGELSKAIEWLADSGDPKIACHPAVSLVMDLVWSGAAYRTFLAGKTWLLFCIVVYVTAQSVLNRWEDVYVNPGQGGVHVLVDHNPLGVRAAIFAMRLFLYIFSMGRWVQYHARHMYADYKSGALLTVWRKVRVPSYLATWQNRVSLLLAVGLLLMFVQCPILYCLGRTSPEQAVAQRCEGSKSTLLPYSVLAAISTVLYALLLTDVAVFSTRLSAFLLVCGRMLPELWLFLVGVLFTALTFAAAISALEQFNPDFAGLPMSMLSLIKITLCMFDGDSFDRLGEYPHVLVAVFIYVVSTSVFFVNLLIAQLSCLYQGSYKDLLGYARLNRARILVETMPRVDKRRWTAFVASLRLGEPVEFGEGDTGIAGGIQVLEPGNANPTTRDMIRRYGGSTARSAPWPAEGGGDADEDRLERLASTIEQCNRRIAKLIKATKRGYTGSGSSQSALSSNASEVFETNLER